MFEKLSPVLIQMSLSPKPKLVSPISKLALELDTRFDLFIPELPDDVALQCLLRVSVDNHMACKAVCKRWHSLFNSKEHFFTMRKLVGLCDPWLYILAFEKSTKRIEWRVLDLTQFSWHTIPSMPCNDNVSPHGFNCVTIPHESVLYILGGVVSDADSPLNLVLKYEMVKNRWTVMTKMTTTRSFFASGVIEGMIYIAGGNGPELFELNSSEVFDPKMNVWRNIGNMCTNMASFDSTVLDGKLLVTEGWFWPFCVRPSGQIYDPLTNKWEGMADGLREGWTGSSVVVYGHLFVVTEHEKTRLKVYEKESDSWSLVEGDSVPETICKPFCVSSWECKIFIVGQSLCVAVGNISRVFFSGNRCRFRVQWDVIDAVKTVGNLTPANVGVVLA